MKKLLLVTALFSTQVFAAQEAVLIENPAINGIHFTHTSNVNGVCRILGYEKGANGSITDANVSNLPMMTANSNGTVTKGNTGSQHKITSIICINKVSDERLSAAKINPEIEVSQYGNSSDEDKVIGFGHNSDMDGVCKHYGYSHAADGSEITLNVSDTPLVTVNSTGRPTKSDFGFSHKVTDLICIGNSNQENATPYSIVLEMNPTHLTSGIPYTHTSNTKGICLNLGHDNSVSGNPQYVNVSNTSMLKVNSSGEIIGANNGSDHKVTEVLCYNDSGEE